jgi:hypothetical protein
MSIMIQNLPEGQDAYIDDVQITRCSLEDFRYKFNQLNNILMQYKLYLQFQLFHNGQVSLAQPQLIVRIYTVGFQGG